MKRSLRVLGVSGLAVGAAWFVMTRRRDEFRDFVTHRFDPLVMRFGLAGGRMSPWATVEHVGRRSGTVYHTPIYPRSAGDHVYIPLPYGTDVQWVRNIKAAGHCRIQLHETLLELDEPAVIPASENPMLPSWLADRFERSGRSYVRLHILDRVPGTFVPEHPAPAAAPMSSPEHPIEIVHPSIAGEHETIGV